MDLVRDSVSAQARTGPKPMFMNNYFVGDNNWRTVAGEKPDAMRQTDESKNRSSIAVQTAVSLLGEEDKPARFVQTGISRMKAMGNNEGVYNTQSPLVVEPAKNGNSTGWSTNSFNLPEVHQNTSVRQQCKGLPDLTVPPPPIQDHTLPQGQSETNTSGRAENAILRVIERMTDTMEQQMLHGGYTQILVNPVQLTDAEITNWMEKLVEARKNRQERKPRPYRNFQKPYNSDQSEYKKPQLKNKLHSAQELDVQSIMTTFNCEYNDVVEAVDLYNMDVEESQSA